MNKVCLPIKCFLSNYSFDIVELMMNVTNRTPTGPTLNLNREKKPKYAPPKGAPDADMIFGPK
jgi:hypothetical protein